MSTDLPNFLGIHASAMSLHSRRLELISGNIANVDTPGYQAKTLDFQQTLQALEAQMQSAAGSRASAAPAAHNILSSLEPVLRTATQPSMDGNTVDIGREQAEFAEAALRYRASMNFVEGRMRGLLTAITGE